MKAKVFYLATKITVAVVLVAMLVIEANASGTPKLKMVPYASERALIAMINNTDLKTVLTIEDATGDVIYYREGRITDEIYSKKFDFANFSDGDYKVSVANKNGKDELYFSINDNIISLDIESNLNEPFVDIKDNVLKLSMLNNSLEDISLVVSNKYGVVYKKSLGNNFNINAGFNLASLESGDYAINITNGVKTYSYNFNK
jgi:hypothetical protein